MASNHDKIVVVDNEYAIVGGRNVSKDYFVDPEDHPTAYRDCDVLIRSADVAASLDAAFTEEFFMLKQYEIEKNLGLPIHIRNEMMTAYAAMDSWIRGNGAYVAPKTADAKTLKAVEEYNAELAVYKHMINFDGFDPMKGAHDAPVKIIDKNSLVGSRNDITDQLVRFIDSCKHEVIIQNPYVVLTERAEAALKRASRRGVRVILHTNSPISTDSAATQAMFYRDWKRILKEIPTAAIYVFYGQRKLHAKTFTFDGKVGIVGTYNMDYISEEVNSEVVAAISHRPFTLELRSGIMKNIAESKKYEIQMNEKGEAESVLGPDDMKTKNLWIIKTLSRLGFAKYII